MGEPPQSKPHFHGHRARLRARLLEVGADALPDYELLEFLLTAANARGDTKPLAKTLLKRFGGIAGVLGASRDALAAVPGMGDAAAAHLLAVRAAAARMARSELMARPVIGSWDKLVDYCNTAAGFAETEVASVALGDREIRSEHID